MTPHARKSVRSIRMVKRALPYTKDFDSAEWRAATEYMAQNLPGLSRLSLGIVAGKPGGGGGGDGGDGWVGVEPYTATDLVYMQDTDGMEWIQDLLRIKGLERLDVDAVVEHCPPPMSKAMERYVRFSASVGGTFSEFLRERMVTRA